MDISALNPTVAKLFDEKTRDAAYQELATRDQNRSWYTIQLGSENRVKHVLACPQGDLSPMVAVFFDSANSIDSDSNNATKGTVQYIDAKGNFLGDPVYSVVAIADLNGNGIFEEIREIEYGRNPELVYGIRMLEIRTAIASRPHVGSLLFLDFLRWRFEKEALSEQYRLVFFWGFESPSLRHRYAEFSWQTDMNSLRRSAGSRRIVRHICPRDPEFERDLAYKVLKEDAKRWHTWYWNDQKGVTIFDSDTFVWYDRVVNDDLFMEFEYRGEEAIVLIYGNGGGFGGDTLIINLKSGFQSIRLGTIHKGATFLANNRVRFPTREVAQVTITIKGRQVKVSRNDELVLEGLLPISHERIGRLGFYKYGRGTAVYSNVKINGAEPFAPDSFKPLRRLIYFVFSSFKGDRIRDASF